MATGRRGWPGFFDIKNWIPGVNGCPEARAGRLVQVVHRRDPRAAQRPPRVCGAAAHGFTKFYREWIGRSGPAATYTDDRDEGRVRLVRRDPRRLRRSDRWKRLAAMQAGPGAEKLWVASRLLCSVPARYSSRRWPMLRMAEAVVVASMAGVGDFTGAGFDGWGVPRGARRFLGAFPRPLCRASCVL